jgi:hypothetical protein
MTAEELRKLVVEKAKEIGEREMQARLIRAGASPNTAQKLTSNRYPHEPGGLLERAIKEALDSDQEAS